MAKTASKSKKAPAKSKPSKAAPPARKVLKKPAAKPAAKSEAKAKTAVKAKVAQKPVAKAPASKKAVVAKSSAGKTSVTKAVKKNASKPVTDVIKAGKWVYNFGGGKAEGKAGMRDLLGGKGANLAEMANLGLPVPPGFTIPTSVCTYFYAHGKSLSLIHI